MNKNSFKASWIILAVSTSAAIAIGLLLLFAPTMFIEGEFLAYTGQSLAAFEEVNPEAYAFLMLEDSEMGLFLLTIGVLSLLITVGIYRNKRKWGWWLLLISSTLTIGGVFGFNLPTGDLTVILMPAVLLAVSYIGLGLGAKSILRRT